MSKIFGAVRFDFGIFRWIFVHFFVSFHFIRFDLYCYKIAPRSFQLPAYLWCTLLDLERIGGLGKRQSRAELCNQVIGIHTFFIWPYLSCTQINRAIESLRHVIRIWTPFLAVPFFSFFWLLCRCCVFICPFFGCFYPAHFPTTAYTFCSQPTHTHSHTHIHLRIIIFSVLVGARISIDYHGESTPQQWFQHSTGNIFIIIERAANRKYYSWLP